jgi:hypothetical protein
VRTFDNGPLVARGSLAAWEREYRARLAVAEEVGEIARMQAELDTTREQLAVAVRERDAAVQALQAARKPLRDVRGSRAYKVMRRLGRWSSVEKDMRRALG